MNQLYPIVRRKRRPLMPVDDQVAPVVPAAESPIAPPAIPAVAPEPPSTLESPEAKAEPKRKRR